MPIPGTAGHVSAVPGPCLLSRLEGTITSRGALRLVEVQAGRFPEEHDAVVAVASERPAIHVKHFAGRPAARIPPWIEATVPPYDERFAAEVVAALGTLLPPGGRLMVVYRQDETERGLQRGIPPAATPLGHALYLAGCTWFKDWYFAEGGREGETKLQGNKPPDAEAERREVARLHADLRGWLDGVPERSDELTGRARERALAILRP